MHGPQVTKPRRGLRGGCALHSYHTLSVWFEAADNPDGPDNLTGFRTSRTFRQPLEPDHVRQDLEPSSL